MQRVKYISPSGKEVIFAHNEPNLPYIFEKITGIGAAEVDIITAKSVAEDGSTIQRIDVKDREITVYVHIRGDSREELYQNRRELIRILSIEESRTGKKGRLEYENDYVQLWIPCIVKKGPEVTQRAGNYHTSVALVFYCESPYFRNTKKSIYEMAFLDGAFSFPLSIPIDKGVRFGARAYSVEIQNKGDAPTPVEVRITAPTKFPKIIKKSTGEYIQVKKELKSNEELYINTDKDQFNVELRNGNISQSAIDYLAIGSKPFTLEPGKNVLLYESGDDTNTSRVFVEMCPFYRGA